ncbi:hypothetical protein [Burkholderia multivorans]|uniref:hypothetical protein n=2 Tax=Pseudomonadota TaxID=1224 RepID=UPI0019D2486F|nr:hypothetical protein [Burkholderia multivorans]MBN6728757.1 hypothetical protein [Burkholderia multivorans]MBN6728760.1 hypothetical protein [Burkholderia multivorans]
MTGLLNPSRYRRTTMKTLRIKWVADVLRLGEWIEEPCGEFDTEADALRETQRAFPGLRVWARTVEVLA